MQQEPVEEDDRKEPKETRRSLIPRKIPELPSIQLKNKSSGVCLLNTVECRKIMKKDGVSASF